MNAKERVTNAKKATAELLARVHYRVEPGIVAIIRIVSSDRLEASPTEPVKLLEVNENTVPVGIRPVGFDAAPAMGITSPSVIVEITPDEYESVRKGDIRLPRGWRLGEELPRERSAH